MEPLQQIVHVFGLWDLRGHARLSTSGNSAAAAVAIMFSFTRDKGPNAMIREKYATILVALPQIIDNIILLYFN